MIRHEADCLQIAGGTCYRSAVVGADIRQRGAAPGTAPAAGESKSPPPFEFKWLPGWSVEHVAFTWGNAGKPLGGPARWAVGGTCVHGCYPTDHAESKRIYFIDKRRQIWLLDQGQLWPIAGTGDLGHENGPAESAVLRRRRLWRGHSQRRRQRLHGLHQRRRPAQNLPPTMAAGASNGSRPADSAQADCPARCSHWRN